MTLRNLYSHALFYCAEEATPSVYRLFEQLFYVSISLFVQYMLEVVEQKDQNLLLFLFATGTKQELNYKQQI